MTPRRAPGGPWHPMAEALRVSLVGLAVLASMAIPAGLPGAGLPRPRPAPRPAADLVSDYELMMRRWRRAMQDCWL